MIVVACSYCRLLHTNCECGRRTSVIGWTCSRPITGRYIAEQMFKYSSKRGTEIKMLYSINRHAVRSVRIHALYDTRTD